MSSVWQSTADLLEAEVTRRRVEWLHAARVSLPGMDAGHRYELAEHLHTCGLDLAWTEEQIPNLNELLDH